MKRPYYMIFVFLLMGIFAIVVTLNGAHARPMPKPTPKPAERTTVKSGKSNTSDREIQPTPAPIPTPVSAEGTINTAESNSLCQSNRAAPPPPPQDGNPDTQKPKKCRCLGRSSDGPLEGLCVIPCSCPSNCDSD